MKTTGTTPDRMTPEGTSGAPYEVGPCSRGPGSSPPSIVTSSTSWTGSLRPSSTQLCPGPPGVGVPRNRELGLSS